MTDQLREKVRASVQRFQDWCPPEGFYLAFSGGKDSVVIKRLAEMAGVPFDAHYNNTSVDPPELVRFIMDQHPDVHREFPADEQGKRITMRSLIEKKMYPPTRRIRYCCEHLKESAGDGRMTVTGVRWAESAARKKNQGIASVWKNRQTKGLLESPDFSQNKAGDIILTNDNDDSRKLVEGCFRHAKTLLNPIIDWTDEDVWEFIHAEGIPYCCLYEEGHDRLGCIGCPVANMHEREREFARWPKYQDMYIRAFDRMLKRRAERGKPDDPWVEASPMDIFRWWMEYPVLIGQMSFDDFLEDPAQDKEDDYAGWVM